MGGFLWNLSIEKVSNEINPAETEIVHITKGSDWAAQYPGNLMKMVLELLS